MKYKCAHRWVFKSWGGGLEPSEDTLAPLTGHAVTLRVTHCGVCHSDLHIQAGGFDMGGGKHETIVTESQQILEERIRDWRAPQSGHRRCRRRRGSGRLCKPARFATLVAQNTRTPRGAM